MNTYCKDIYEYRYKDAAKSVLLSSRSVTTRSISLHRKLQRKCRCLVQTNGLNDRIDLSPSSSPRLSAKVESLYRNDAARQVEAAQHNALADYGELYQLRRENKILSDTNENMESNLNTLLGQLVYTFSSQYDFTVADALISGQPIPVSSGGGDNSDSDLRWDGRRPDEEEEAYRRRCLFHASHIIRFANSGYRKY